MVSGTYTSSDPKHIGIMTPYGDNEWLANNIFKCYTFLEDKVRSSMWVGDACVFNNATFEIYSYEGTEDKPYEQYGASPSIDYPSEIKTVKDSVQVNVSNSNMLDFNVTQDKKVTVNDDGTITINGTGGFFLKFKEISLKKGITYYTNYQVISGTAINSKEEGKIFLKLRNAQGKYLHENSFNEDIYQDDISSSGIWIHSNAVFTNAKIKIWTSTEKSDFVPHQSQTVIMPIQQEMLTGDYISDKEYHNWNKYVFTGEENISKSGVEVSNSYLINQNSIPDLLNAELLNDNTRGTIVPNFLSTHFKTLAPVDVVYHNNIGITLCANSSNLKDVTIRFGFGLDSNINTVDKCKAWLKSQYDAGTPVVVYYKLATQVYLELTEEQKAIRDTKLYTYKNITNIDVSDELASIDVTYRKDLETMFNNIIKQIPSSTSDTVET